MEYWDLYDKEGKYVGAKIARNEPLPHDTFHRVVHIWIINENKEFLIQKRAAHLKWFPNKWATTTGSVLSGEFDINKAAYRELKEELNLDETEIDLNFLQDLIIGNSLVSILYGFLPSYKINDIQLNDEVSDIRWMKKTKIEILRKEDSFAHYSPETFELVYKLNLQ